MGTAGPLVPLSVVGQQCSGGWGRPSRALTARAPGSVALGARPRRSARCEAAAGGTALPSERLGGGLGWIRGKIPLWKGLPGSEVQSPSL